MSKLVKWPAAVLPPEPFDSDYAYIQGDSRVRTMMEQGTPRQRRMGDLVYDVFKLRWRFTPNQYEMFRGFVDTGLHGGADFFSISVFIDDGYTKVTARFQQGSIDRRLRVDGRWEVSASLEVIDLPVMSQADLAAAIGAPPPDTRLYPWPTGTLDPDPLNENFAQVIADGIVRDDLTNGGRIDQARPFRQMPAIYEWSIPLTNAQYAVFRGFMYWRASKGEGWFTAPMFRGGSYETQKVRTVAGTRQDTRSGGDWIVTAQLEVADLAPLSIENTLAALLLADSGTDWATIAGEMGDITTAYQTATT